MMRVIKTMVTKAMPMAMKVFNVLDKDDGYDCDSFDDGGDDEENSDGDNYDEEDRSMAVLMFTLRCWSVSPDIRDGDDDKGDGDEGNGDEGL